MSIGRRSKLKLGLLNAEIVFHVWKIVTQYIGFPNTVEVSDLRSDLQLETSFLSQNIYIESEKCLKPEI